MVAERYGRGDSRLSRGDQGAADDSGGRRDPVAECGAAAASGFVFVREPEKMDIMIFRENTEDVYIGIEWKSGSAEAKKVLEFLNNDMLKDGKKQIRWDSGVGIKPISPTGTKRLVRRAIKYALANKRKSVTLVHKGNIQKFTEGGFRDWGYELAQQEFRADTVTERESWIIDNLDKNPQLTVEQNAALIEPGIEQAPEAFKK